MTLHCGALAVTVPACEAGVGFDGIGRALALVGDAALLLGIPAANRAVDRMLWERGVQEGPALGAGQPRMTRTGLPARRRTVVR